jgi:hypothetical protein
MGWFQVFFASLDGQPFKSAGRWRRRVMSPLEGLRMEARWDDMTQGDEAVKKSLDEQKHFAQRRQAGKGAKETKQLFFASLRALASLREIVYLFTASFAVGNTMPPLLGLEESLAGRRRRGGRRGRRSLFLLCHSALQQAGEVMTKNLGAVPAFPQRVLRVEIIEIDATAGAHYLQSCAASLNNFDIINSHRKVHRSSS